MGINLVKWKELKKMKEKRKLKMEIKWTKSAIEGMKELGWQEEEIRETEKELEEMKRELRKLVQRRNKRITDFL